MSDGPQGLADPDAGARAQAGHQIAVLLACFSGRKNAGTARRGIDTLLRSRGTAVLDSVVLEVDAKRKASVHDPARVVKGTLTAFLTWGVFGLIAGGLQGLAVWAILGAMCGGLWALYTEHLLMKDELTRIGAHVPADSSALVMFAETADVRGLLVATAGVSPATASAASIGDDLSTRVFVGAADPIEIGSTTGGGSLPSDRVSVVSMVLLRYANAGTAKEVARRIAAEPKGSGPQLAVELVLHTDADGRRHVSSPAAGAAANSLQSLISWAAFGLLCGAIIGFAGGGGLLAAVDNAAITGVLWGIFGIVAGALFGLWAGRGTSGRRLRSVGGILAPNTSMVLAWTDAPLADDALKPYLAEGARRLVLRFNPVPGGAVLEAV